jgi:hypothetical protein
MSSASASPQQGAQAPQGQPQGEPSEEDVLQAVGQTLEQFKAQLPVFEQMKQSNPQAYQAVMGMVEGMVAMAQRLAGGSSEASPPAGAKGGGPYQEGPGLGPKLGKAENTKVEVEPHEALPPMEVLRKLYDTVSGNSMAMAEWRPTNQGFHEFIQGFRHEKREHPHLDAHQTALTTYQHLAEDPQYYSKLGILEQSGVLGKEEVATRHPVVLPPGSHGVGARARSVKVVEPVTGKATWHQVSVGQKLSGDNHPLSPRVGECPSADSPEKRAADAGLVGAPTTAKPGQSAKE